MNPFFIDKGDFLALIQRNSDKDTTIARSLQNKWRSINQSNKYKLIDFKLSMPEVTLDLFNHITPAG